MSELFSNEYFKIIKKNENIYKIVFYSQNIKNKLLIESLIKTKLILGATATNDYTILQFKALSIKSFQEYEEEKINKKKFTIIESANMLYSLSIQLNYLLSNLYTFLGYNTKDIFVIDNHFLFLNTEYMNKINEKNMISITCPFSPTDFFISPELLKIKILPFDVHFKTIYFSLACFILYVLSKDNLNKNNDFYIEYLNADDKYFVINKYLNLLSINETKLYWTLSRCFAENPSKRNILFI